VTTRFERLVRPAEGLGSRYDRICWNVPMGPWSPILPQLRAVAFVVSVDLIVIGRINDAAKRDGRCGIPLPWNRLRPLHITGSRIVGR
jgi:hypothetical protein